MLLGGVYKPNANEPDQADGAPADMQIQDYIYKSGNYIREKVRLNEIYDCPSNGLNTIQNTRYVDIVKSGP